MILRQIIKLAGVSSMKEEVWQLYNVEWESEKVSEKGRYKIV